jgi:hypothetical protein
MKFNPNNYNLSNSLISEIVSNDGIQNIIYKYNDSYVLKVPRKNIFSKFIKSNPDEHDLEIIQKYFSKYIPKETKIIHPDKAELPSVVIQQFIPGLKYIYTKDLSNPLIRNQVEEIFSQCKSLYKNELLSLDLVGWAGAMGLVFQKLKQRDLGMRLTNLGISGDKVFLVDFRLTPTIFEIGYILKPVKFIQSIYGRIEYWFMRKYLKRMLS